MRQPLIVANWKMNMDNVTGFELMDDMLDQLDTMEEVAVAICPPFPLLESFAELFDGTNLYLGAQNMYWEDKGAYTGEVSGPMLKALGCDFVILGHSERRQYFGDTDETVRRKIEAALRNDLKPILCVGESFSENQDGQTLDVISRQVSIAFAGLDEIHAAEMVVAYEPIWAIGTGLAASGEGANDVIGAIRALIGDMHGHEVAQQVRILYGGSVNPDNIAQFIGQGEIDGALVGGASLDPEGFVRIVAVTHEAKTRAAR